MSSNPESYLYTDSHEWVEAEGDVRRVGISDHAQHLLGDIVYAELPEVGATFKKGEEMVQIESPKAAAEVYAPLSGEIVEINEELESSPETINESPFDEGWIVKIRPTNPDEASSLLSLDKYKELTEG